MYRVLWEDGVLTIDAIQVKSMVDLKLQSWEQLCANLRELQGYHARVPHVHRGHGSGRPANGKWVQYGGGQGAATFADVAAPCSAIGGLYRSLSSFAGVTVGNTVAVCTEQRLHEATVTGIRLDPDASPRGSDAHGSTMWASSHVEFFVQYGGGPGGAGWAGSGIHRADVVMIFDAVGS